MFFLALGLGRSLRILPAYTVLVGALTCWLPGTLIMMDAW
ncbi:MAG: AmiS/UreI family transporter [Alcaligenes aquatilis]